MKHSRSKAKQFLPAVLTAALSAAYLAGCGAKSAALPAEKPGNTGSSKDPVTLSFYVWNAGESYVADVIDAFNAMHQDIRVELHYLGDDDYEGDLASVLTAGDADLFGCKGMSPLIHFIEEGRVLDISDYVSEGSLDGSLDLTAFGSMFNDITYQGKYYSLPSRTTCWELYYNKDLFDAANLPYPTQMTWSEYAKLSSFLTDPASDVYGGYWVNWVPNFYAIQQGSYLIDDNLDANRASLALLHRLMSEDCSHVPYDSIINAEDPSRDVYQQFENGKVAMVPQGEWMLKILLEDKATVNWDIAPMPVPNESGDGTTWGQYQFISVTKSCKNPDAAFTFIKFFCGKEGSAIRAQNAIIPAYTDKEIIQDFLNASPAPGARYFFDARKFQEALPLKGYEDARQAFSDNADLYLSGKISLDECMKRFDTERRSFFR